MILLRFFEVTPISSKIIKYLKDFSNLMLFNSNFELFKLIIRISAISEIR